MPAIPLITFDKGFQNINRGILIDCPVEFFSKSQMSFYLNTKAGWSVCPLGYLTFIRFDALGRKVVVPGVYPSDEKIKVRRKFPNYQLRINRRDVEAYVEEYSQISTQIRKERDNEFRNLTHDLRAVGAEIYNTALTARNNAEAASDEASIGFLDNVLAAQQMLSIRLDIVDYESGFAASQPKQAIPIYRKIDKVLRCFHNRFSNRAITYEISGTTYQNIYGPPIFEIIPFVLVENAIKYSPFGGPLKIRFEEKEDTIIVRFESFGPTIRDSEKDKIFDQHFRGDAAKQTEQTGSGIGLFAAKTLTVSQYGGDIYVNQLDDKIWSDDQYYFLTRFTLIFPIYNDDEQRDRNRELRIKRRPAFFKGLRR